MENVLLQASLYLAAAVIAVPISQRLGLGSVLGYLLAGIFLSPFLHLIGSDTEQIQHYAEFGIVILLFLIGLEMRPKRIWEMRESLIGLGGSQIFITTSIITFIATTLSLPWQSSLAIAIILSLSSTAIVLQTLTEKKLQHTEGGKSATAILLMQDVAVIPILAILPLLGLQELQVDALLSAVLSGEEVNQEETSQSIIGQLPDWIAAIAIASAIATIILASKYLTEPIIKYISQYGTHEIFLAATFLLIISVAYLMTLVGLSPALGTFLVGLVLSNSKHRHVLASHLDPFKGLLLGLFFITVGAGINFSLLFQNFFSILGFTISLVIIKGSILFILSKIFLLEKKSSFLIAIYLSQAGEFGFVLLALAQTAHVIPPSVAENLSLVIALSMLTTPLILYAFEKLAFTNLHSEINLNSGNNIYVSRAIVIGWQRIGKTVSEILIKHGIETIILDNSSLNIKELRQRGVKALLGEPSNPKLLIKAGIEASEVIIIDIPNIKKSIDTTTVIMNKFPGHKIIVSATTIAHYKELSEIGATEIILEPHYSSLHVAEKALETIGESTSEINKTISKFDDAWLHKLSDEK